MICLMCIKLGKMKIYEQLMIKVSINIIIIFVNIIIVTIDMIVFYYVDIYIFIDI